MRSGIPLSTLREEVLIEAGLSSQPGHSTFNIDRINQMINRTERSMIVENEWPTLAFEEEITVAADAQYVDLPSNISFTMIENIYVAYGSEWFRLTSGIGANERTIYNSTQRALPISRYEYRANNPTKLEIWPIGGVEQTLMIEGSKTVGAMREETDVCALDADVIVMRVAAAILGRENKADAELLLSQATTLANQLTKRQGSAKRENINFGRRKVQTRRPGIDYIPPGST